MSTQSQPQSSAMSMSNSQGACLDPLDSMLDLSEYENVVQYQSPSLSPSSSSKSQFATRPVSRTPPTLPSSQQPMLSGPSHNYDLYRQQTGIPQGAVANTLAINSSNMHINNSYGFGDGYLSDLSPSDDFVDFGTAPRQFKPEVDMEFESNSEPAFFYPEQQSDFIDPSNIGSLPSTTLPSQSNNVGRLWPGMHQQQAALAKAQAQQKQQQQIIQQQRQSSMGHQSKQSTSRPRGSHPPTDPIVEEKISQLLNSMRQSSVTTEDGDSNSQNNNMSQAHRMRKDEEEMDEDERLLASEEGKKLSSKERRQLRNKVSARAFRSRRKEYIGQLEGEIAIKVNENNDLRTQNRALMEENTRLSDLTRMLLSSPSFSGFLDTLSSNPAAAQTAQAVQTQAPQQQQMEQPQRQVKKDVNPYAAQQQMQQQTIGMTMIPEHTMDFSMLDLGTDGFYQPQVFSVLDVPETVIDSDILSGKSSELTSLFSDNSKVEIPVLDRLPESDPEKEFQFSAPAPAEEVVEQEISSDPAFALYSSPSTTELSLARQDVDVSALISSISLKPETFELVVQDSADGQEIAIKRVERMCASMEAAVERLSLLTSHL